MKSLLVLSLLGIFGCVENAALERVRTSARASTGCKTAGARPLGALRYEVSACGRRSVYICDGEVPPLICVREGQDLR